MAIHGHKITEGSNIVDPVADDRLPG